MKTLFAAATLALLATGCVYTPYYVRHRRAVFVPAPVVYAPAPVLVGPPVIVVR
jgi:hypothetical protein